MAVQPKPAHYHTVTPCLLMNNAAEALDFYAKAFGAKETMRFPGEDGKIMHSEIMIGDSPVMVCDEYPEMDYRGPQSRGGTTVTLMAYVDDCDAVFNQAVAAGATVLRPLENQFYGDRSGTVTDPYGHIWTISTHVEDVSPEQMAQRFDDWKASQNVA